jgi:hypothetical protein
MHTSTRADLSPYQAPQLRVLGALHELTRGGISSARSDGVLFQGEGGGRVVNGS